MEGHLPGCPTCIALWPAVGHLELTSAAVRSAHDLLEGMPVALTDMAVLRPLVIDGYNSGQVIEINLHHGGEFAVCFGPVFDGMLDDADECFEGVSVAADSTVAQNYQESMRCTEVSEIRESCTSILEVHDWNNFFDASWRPFETIWTNSARVTVYSELNKRNETNGLAFHMADLNSLVVLGVNLDYASDGLPPLRYHLLSEDRFSIALHLTGSWRFVLRVFHNSLLRVILSLQ